jgi:CRP-like cAMP-binding protein
MQKLSQIREVELFAGCRPEQLRWIDRHSDVVELPAGSILAGEGERAGQFAVVASGEIDGGVSHFGAASLITGRPQGATVVALTPVRLLVFEARAFRGLLENAPPVARKLLREFVEDAYISAAQTA